MSLKTGSQSEYDRLVFYYYYYVFLLRFLKKYMAIGQHNKHDAKCTTHQIIFHVHVGAAGRYRTTSTSYSLAECDLFLRTSCHHYFLASLCHIREAEAPRGSPERCPVPLSGHVHQLGCSDRVSPGVKLLGPRVKLLVRSDAPRQE